jgi:glycosyltransferase involved in cell wall biosynthesis
MKILFVITSLEMGGAQKILYEHLKNLKNSPIKGHVISISRPSYFSKKILNIGIPVYHLDNSGQKSFFSSFKLIFKLIYFINKFGPDIVSSSMVHANLICSISLLFKKNIKSTWSIHNSNLSFRSNRLRAILIYSFNAILSYFSPTKIIYCSDHSKDIHEKYYYKKNKSVVIHNGIETRKFVPNRNSYLSLREEIGISKNNIIIGSVGRYHPIKDYKTLIETAAILNNKNPNIHFVLCGEGLSWDNEELVSLIDKKKLKSVIHLLGKRKDINLLTSAFDIAVNTSIDESFSLTMAEAMACEIPCVCSDILGLNALMGEDGIYAQVGNAKDFSNKINELIKLPYQERVKIGKKLRKQIEKKYSIKQMNESYFSLYNFLIDT